MHAVKNQTIVELQIWDRVSILVGYGHETGVYEARVEDIINGGIIITNPELISGHTLLRNNLPVIVQFTRDDAAYQFRSRIHVHGDNRARRIILTPPSGFQRVQRRMFARIDLAVRIAYAILPVDGRWELWQREAVWIETETVNVSASGVLLRARHRGKVEDLIAARFDIAGPTDFPTDVIAVCRRTIEQDSCFLAGFEFILRDDLHRYFSRRDLGRIPRKYRCFDRTAQDRLVAYLFHKQIEFRHKGQTGDVEG
ncbi:MAG: flagellar brake domain-containing protein [Candidatus Zixiibacteriota bacterium]